MRTRMAVIGASVALAIGGLAACSNGDGDVVRSGGATVAQAGNPAEALQLAAQKTTDVGTAKLSMTFALSGVPGLDSTTFTMDGAVDTEAEQSQFSMDLAGLTGALPADQQAGIGAILGDGKIEIVSDGGDVYMKLGSLATLLGATSDKEWLKVTADDGGAGAIGAPIGDGTQILALLEQAGDVETVGTEQVRGAETTHYRGTVDVAKALDAADAGDRAKAEAELGQAGIDVSAASVPVDVWIGTDGLVRRVQVGVEGVESSSAPAGVGGTMTMELYDFGQPVDITVPSADQVFEVDPEMLGGLAGLAGR